MPLFRTKSVLWNWKLAFEHQNLACIDCRFGVYEIDPWPKKYIFLFFRLRHVTLCATLRKIFEWKVALLSNCRFWFLQSQERVRQPSWGKSESQIYANPWIPGKNQGKNLKNKKINQYLSRHLSQPSHLGFNSYLTLRWLVSRCAFALNPLK